MKKLIAFALVGTLLGTVSAAEVGGKRKPPVPNDNTSVGIKKLEDQLQLDSSTGKVQGQIGPDGKTISQSDWKGEGKKEFLEKEIASQNDGDPIGGSK